VTVSSGYAGTQSSPRPAPQALEVHYHLAGTDAAAVFWGAAGSPPGSHAAQTLGPPVGWAPAGTACTALKSSWEVEEQCQAGLPKCLELPVTS
jgi:hypothetical protein